MPNNPDKHAVEQAARDRRLKEALRVNLQRRKQKARALKSDAADEGKAVDTDQTKDDS